MKTRELFHNIFSKIRIRESPKERYTKLFQTIIKEVSQDEMFIALAQIKGNTYDWYATLNSPAYPDTERYNTFITVSHEIEQIYQDPQQINATNCHRYFICLVQNIPIGVMTFVPGGSRYCNESNDKIGFMLTHPGSQGCGSLLVEKAVEISCSLGNGGELLVSAKHYAVPFYKNLGFEVHGISDFATTSMIVYPSERNEWVFIGNTYRLSRYLSH
ncbi:GNAT family N-acetyltransferase [Xenorhabdus kozodoii]|uniref:N-acetyltransferase n=1 Tax=Xenorhabdus kozodoii TaxID=351676 RepID=A0A2D0LF76_9GAMM|nr:GNAT family N-acetyltransferase [Xenorhabdus kozodoii]PHM74366.1 N-acetyltransferase [Xenorhabdus kozodoii]